MARERYTIPLGALDVSTPEHSSPEGTLRFVRNLCPIGSREAAMWSPVEGAQAVGDVAGARAIGLQVRQRFGALADLVGDPDQGLERLLVADDEKLYAVDPDQAFASKELYSWPSAEATRKIQFAVIGNNAYLAPSAGEGIGAPETVLEVRDDAVLELSPPDLPNVEVSGTSVAAGPALEDGFYVVRYAWLFKDGSFGPASAPMILQVTVDSGSSHVGATLSFEITSYPEVLPSGWEDLIGGLAVLMTTRQSDVGAGAEGLASMALHHVATFRTTATATTLPLAMTAEEVLASPIYDDQHLTQHHIRAAAAFSHNRRLYLGDVALDFRAPDALALVREEDHSGTRSDAGGYHVRFGVEIETANGSFERIGPVAAVPAVQISLSGYRVVGHSGNNWAMGWPAYPDRRAKRLKLYVNVLNQDDADYELHSQWDLSPYGNVAVTNQVIFPDINISVGAIGTPMADPADVNGELDRDPNRVYISDSFQPRSMRAARALHIGDGPHDGVVGFGSNALAVSEGQYGEWPVYVFCQATTYALEAGPGDVAVASSQPIAKRGCVSRYGVTNVDNVVAFASRDGIWLLEPGLRDQPVSKSLHYNNLVKDFFGCLDETVALGYFNDDKRGRRELWVSTVGMTFGFSFNTARWFLMDRRNRVYGRHKARLYGGTHDTGILEDQALSMGAVGIALRTSGCPLGAEGTYKRLFGLSIGQRHGVDLLGYKIVDRDINGSDVELGAGFFGAGPTPRTHSGARMLHPRFEITGLARPGQTLEKLVVDLEHRLGHRRPYLVAEDIDAEPLWNCEEGFSPEVAVAPYADCPGPRTFGDDDAEGGVVTYTVDLWDPNANELEEVSAEITHKDGVPIASPMWFGGVSSGTFIGSQYRLRFTITFNAWDAFGADGFATYTVRLEGRQVIDPDVTVVCTHQVTNGVEVPLGNTFYTLQGANFQRVNFGDQTVQVLPALNAFTGSSPMMRVDAAAGMILILHFKMGIGHVLRRFSPDGFFLRELVLGFTAESGMGMDRVHREVFVSNATTKQVLAYDYDLNFLRVVGVDTHAPTSPAYDPRTDRVYWRRFSANAIRSAPRLGGAVVTHNDVYTGSHASADSVVDGVEGKFFWKRPGVSTMFAVTFGGFEAETWWNGVLCGLDIDLLRKRIILVDPDSHNRGDGLKKYIVAAAYDRSVEEFVNPPDFPSLSAAFDDVELVRLPDRAIPAGGPWRFFKFRIHSVNGGSTLTGFREVELYTEHWGANVLGGIAGIVVTASSEDTSGGQAKEQVIDGSFADGNGWLVAQTGIGTVATPWIQLELPVGEEIMPVQIGIGAYPTTSTTAARSANHVSVEASNDGLAWTLIAEGQLGIWSAPFNLFTRRFFAGVEGDQKVAP